MGVTSCSFVMLSGQGRGTCQGSARPSQAPEQRKERQEQEQLELEQHTYSTAEADAAEVMEPSRSA